MAATRPTIPPSSLPDDAEDQTFEVLQRHLVAAEQDTKRLVEKLAQMGFKGDTGESKTKSQSPIPPLALRNADQEVLQRNYEALVSRVCKAESAVQTLKLNLLRLQADSDLHRKDKMSSSEKLSTAVETYEKEVNKLNRDLMQTRTELKQANDSKERALAEVHQLQDALKQTASSKSEASEQITDMKMMKEKLHRRLAEVQDQLSREASLRESLEQSHNTMLQRVKDMENVVDSSREEVKTMTASCSSLKQENVQMKATVQEQISLRQTAEEAIQQLLSQQEESKALFTKTCEERDFLMREVGRMRSQYSNLIKQLDHMKKLVEERQSTKDQLEKENKNLYEAMKTSAAQNAQLIATYEQQLEEERAGTAQKYQMHEQAVHLQEQLQSVSKERAQLHTQCTTQEEQLKDLGAKLTLLEENHKKQTSKLEDKCTVLKEKVKALEQEKERVLHDKEGLLEEVNQAVDGMTEEKSRLEEEVQRLKLELQAASKARDAMKEENSRLLARIGSVEQHQEAQKQIEAALADMLEEKTKLAYDKGRLQSRVDQLQSELEALANAHSDLNQLRKKNSALEAQYTKSQMELNACQISLQRLENELKQKATVGERKEKDFMLAIRARDEAVTEKQQLLAQLQSLQEQGRTAVHGFQKNLADAKQDNQKIASTLSGVMASHSQLQRTVEKLQVQLGKKDNELVSFRNERAKYQGIIGKQQTEIDTLQTKLVSMETIEATEIDPLRKALTKCKEDNVKLASVLEATVQANSKLQGAVQSIEDKLEQKTYMMKQLQDTREQETDEHKQEIRTYEERLENLRQQMMKERDKSYKKTNKDVAEVRKQLDEIVNKNGELSRTNTELRHKITELEYQLKEQKSKLTQQKNQIEHLNKVRARQDESISKMKALGEGLVEMEEAKQKYMKKNKEQAQMIEMFVGQISILQQELKGLSSMQEETAGILQQQEQEIQRQRQANDELRHKLLQSHKRQNVLEDLNKKTEEKLQEANSESLEISTCLQDAHEWFKSKFSALQDDLVRSRQMQCKLERDNIEKQQMLSDEKLKAEETTEKAKAMIRSSRETINRLANMAEVSQNETSFKVHELQRQLQAERDHSQQMQRKLQKLQDSSLRQTEELARELSLLKSQSSFQPYDSS